MRCEAARSVERREIGVDLRLRQRRIARRQAAAGEIGVIGVQRRDIVGIDGQSGKAVGRAAAREIGEIGVEQTGIGAEQVARLPRRGDRREIGAQRREALCVIVGGQPAAREEGRIGVERGGEGGIVGRHRQPGEQVGIAAAGDEGEIAGIEIGEAVEEGPARARAVERGQIGADLRLRQRGIARRHAAARQIVVIGRERLRIAREDVCVEPREGIGLAASLKERQIGGEEIGPLAEEAVERARCLELREPGLKLREIGAAVGRGQVARGKKGEIGVELAGIAREDIGGQAGKGVGRAAALEEGEVGGIELRLVARQRRQQPGARQRLKIGAQRRRVERGIAARQAAACQPCEIGVERVAILACEGEAALVEIGGEQRAVGRAQRLGQPAVGQEADIGIERRGARLREIGRRAAAADEGEIGLRQFGEALPEAVGIAAAAQEGEIGVDQCPVARAEFGEPPAARRIGEEGVDVGKARAFEARRRRARADQVEILAEEAGIGGEEVGTAAPRGEPAQIGADDVGLRGGEGRAAIGALQPARGGDQPREVAARKAFDRGVGDRGVDASCRRQYVARCARGGERVAQRHRHAVLRRRRRAARGHVGDLRRIVARVGRSLRPVRHDQLGLPAWCDREHLAGAEAAQRVGAADERLSGQHMAARGAVGGDAEARRRSAPAHAALDPVGHPHDRRGVAPGDRHAAGVEVDRPVGIDAIVGGVEHRHDGAIVQPDLLQPRDLVDPLADLRLRLAFRREEDVRGERGGGERQAGGGDHQRGAEAKLRIRGHGDILPRIRIRGGGRPTRSSARNRKGRCCSSCATRWRAAGRRGRRSARP